VPPPAISCRLGGIYAAFPAPFLGGADDEWNRTSIGNGQRSNDRDAAITKRRKLI
jgi:hypothetical protein